MFRRVPAAFRVAALALVAWGAALGASRVGVVGDLLLALERKSVDYRMARYRGGRLAQGAAPAGVVVVAVDEASLDALGRFPLWPRSYHARLVDTLRAKGAAVIAFDVLFAEPDTLPADIRAARAGEIATGTGADPAMVAELLAAYGGDEALAEALERAGNVVLATDPVGGARPLPGLVAAAAGVGHAAMAPDPDGMLRRAPARGVGSDAAPPLAVAALAVAQGEAPPLAWEDDGSVVLDLLGPPGTFLTLSYTSVLNGEVDAALLKGSVVFVGATAAGLGDVFSTPFGEGFPGVEAHATLAYQLLHGEGIRPLGGGAALTASLVPTLAAAALVTLAPPVASALGLVAVVAGYVVTAFEAFAQGNVQAPFAFPLLSIVLAALVGGAYRYGTEGRRRRDIQHAFGRYVSPEVVDEIARQPGALKVGGQAREITVGFVDIRGFTGIAEALDPVALARFLHAFFTVVEEEIHGRRGTVDKYIGDAVMMIFGAPNTLPDGPEAACRAALGILDAVAANASQWKALGVPELRVGIGLETGMAVVGNVGSERRFDYTALGDTVNVSSRLQDLNKELGTCILVGPGTRAAAAGAFHFRAMGSRTLRGRPEALPVFELLGPDAGPSSR